MVGLGYVGLPSAIAFHEAGFNVRGLDISEEVITSLSNGESRVLGEYGSLPSRAKMEPFSKYEECIPGADVVIICVPTPVDKDRKPELTAVKHSLDSVISSRNADSNLVVILESTVQPGTTRESIAHTLSLHNDDGDGLSIAYCPERISPGEDGFGVGEVSRVIGAENEDLAEVLSYLYGSITNGQIFLFLR